MSCTSLFVSSPIVSDLVKRDGSRNHYKRATANNCNLKLRAKVHNEIYYLSDEIVPLLA